MRKIIRREMIIASLGIVFFVVWIEYLNRFYKFPIYYYGGPPASYSQFPNRGFWIIFYPVLGIYLIIAGTAMAAIIAYLVGRRHYTLSNRE
jgi:hypothetical protein